MCGICGIAGDGLSRERTLGAVRAMNDTLTHRGPDDGDVWWSPSGGAALGHRRLAIIDLSPGGHQPMLDGSGRYAIVFNGELYNYRPLRAELAALGHRFRSQSDTEVVLEAYKRWGTDCLSRFVGMFAFALCDTLEKRVFLARDRAGEKPLFYWHAAGRLHFASELKGLAQAPDFPRVIDREALEHYLTFGYIPGHHCIYSGVRKVPQGCAMSYDLTRDTISRWRYWDLPTPTREHDAAPDDLVRELDAILEESVRQQLYADVPVGVLLSGGIDSSLVTAMAARVSSAPVRTFTVSFPGHGVYDEGEFARRVAVHFGTAHEELVAEPATVELLPELARQYDEPMADSSMIPTYLVSRLIRRSATVALSGDGGDELFGGYDHYSLMLTQSRVMRAMPRPIRAGVAAVASRSLPPGFRGRNYLIGLNVDRMQLAARTNVYFDAHYRRRLLAPLGSGNGSVEVSPERYRGSLASPEWSMLQRMTAIDFRSYLVDDILVKVDRASMLTSLETRAPWLDHRIIEFAFGRVPDSLRATARHRKILPKMLARRLMPAELVDRPKQGFSLPLQSWFKGRWGEFVRETLLSADNDGFDRSVIEKVLAAQQRGLPNTQRLYALTMFELWRREYRATFA